MGNPWEGVCANHFPRLCCALLTLLGGSSHSHPPTPICFTVESLSSMHVVSFLSPCLLPHPCPCSQPTQDS